MLHITETEIKKRLAFDNPWWESNSIGERERDWPRRAYFDGFMKLLRLTAVNRAVVLMGPRRVGKTVMLTQAVQSLIDDGVAATQIFYVAVDTPTYTGISLERLLRWFMDIHDHKRDTRLYVFFDEIQYLVDWERHLKSLVDSFPAMRFVASGSAAAALKMKSQESGAGRFTDFLLPPLNFAEFLRFEGREVSLVGEQKTASDIDGLNSAFVDYVNYGAFPEAVLKQEVRSQMDRFVANDIVDKVLLRDLPSLYGIHDTQELKRFFTVLAYNTGMEVSYEGLAQSSGVAKNTLRKYLDYLESAFLIHRMHRVDQNAKRFKRVTHFKVYLINPCIRTALFGPVDAESDAMGRMAETAFVSQITPTALANVYCYARWKSGEVDVIVLNPNTQRPMQAYEIKWSDRSVTRPKEELAGLIEFCKNNPNVNARVFTRSQESKNSVEGIEIIFLQLSFVCYVVAHTFIDEQIASGVDPKTFISFTDIAGASG